MGLIDWVHDTGRVIDNLSRLNEELQADVQKLNDESSSVAVAVAEARANEAITNLDEFQRKEAEALEKVKALEKELQGLKRNLEAKAEKDLAVELSVAPEKAQATIAEYKESPSFKSGLEKMGWVSYEFRYKIALMRF
ncbi:hypothetical protein BHE74_00034336 [Ensete ventricosum]|nr:hypothetical protein BHE74_00034336 [Ensete ventricosum]